MGLEFVFEFMYRLTIVYVYGIAIADEIKYKIFMNFYSIHSLN